MSNNNEKDMFNLGAESGGVLITATSGGFQAFAKTNIEHMANSHVLLLVRGIMEILQTEPLILYEAGQEALQKELLEKGVDLNEMKEIPEEALQREGDIDYTNVISLANIKPKGNA